MKIKTECSPNVAGRVFWVAYDADQYDPAPDAGGYNLMGYGLSEQDAIDDLRQLASEILEMLENESH